MRPGDVVIGMLPGAAETKVRPAVVISSETYLVERPDALVGILTTKLPRKATSTDYVLLDWRPAVLRAVSCFRAYVLTIHRSDLTLIGPLSEPGLDPGPGVRPSRLRDLKTMRKQSQRTLPAFASEAEEDAWWYENPKSHDREFAAAVENGETQVLTTEKLRARLNPPGTCRTPAAP